MTTNTEANTKTNNVSAMTPEERGYFLPSEMGASLDGLVDRNYYASYRVGDTQYFTYICTAKVEKDHNLSSWGFSNKMHSTVFYKDVETSSKIVDQITEEGLVPEGLTIYNGNRNPITYRYSSYTFKNGLLSIHFTMLAKRPEKVGPKKKYNPKDRDFSNLSINEQARVNGRIQILRGSYITGHSLKAKDFRVRCSSEGVVITAYTRKSNTSQYKWMLAASKQDFTLCTLTYRDAVGQKWSVQFYGYENCAKGVRGVWKLRLA